MAAMSDAQPSKLNLWVDFLATNKVDETSAPVAGTRRASLYIGGFRIRQPKELNMKRLLGLLLVIGMVGCGGKENAGNAVDPNAEAATSTPAETVDPVAWLEKLEAGIERNEQGEVIDVSLNGTDVTDGGLAHLKGLTKLKVLQIIDTQITDAGLSHLKGMTKLQELWLPSRITDAGVAELKKALPNCKIIN